MSRPSSNRSPASLPANSPELRAPSARSRDASMLSSLASEASRAKISGLPMSPTSRICQIPCGRGVRSTADSKNADRSVAATLLDLHKAAGSERAILAQLLFRIRFRATTISVGAAPALLPNTGGRLGAGGDRARAGAAPMRPRLGRETLDRFDVRRGGGHRELVRVARAWLPSAAVARCQLSTFAARDLAISLSH